jgi:hypothetical protein
MLDAIFARVWTADSLRFSQAAIGTHTRETTAPGRMRDRCSISSPRTRALDLVFVSFLRKFKSRPS